MQVSGKSVLTVVEEHVIPSSTVPTGFFVVGKNIGMATAPGWFDAMELVVTGTHVGDTKQGKGVSKGIKGGESYSNVGGFCLLSRSQARAMLGAAFLVGGGLVALPGLVLVAVGGAAKALSGPVQQVNRLPVVGSYTKAATGAAGRKFSYTPATAQAQT